MRQRQQPPPTYGGEYEQRSGRVPDASRHGAGPDSPLGGSEDDGRFPSRAQRSVPALSGRGQAQQGLGGQAAEPAGTARRGPPAGRFGSAWPGARGSRDDPQARLGFDPRADDKPPREASMSDQRGRGGSSGSPGPWRGAPSGQREPPRSPGDAPLPDPGARATRRPGAPSGWLDRPDESADRRAGGARGGRSGAAGAVDPRTRSRTDPRHGAGSGQADEAAHYGGSQVMGLPATEQAGIGAQGWPASQPHRRGPKGYVRSDERVREDICERLMHDERLDSTDVSVQVESGVVTLEGTVPVRFMKHAIEDLVDHCFGVRDIDNRIRVARPDDPSQSAHPQPHAARDAGGAERAGAKPPPRDASSGGGTGSSGGGGAGGGAGGDGPQAPAGAGNGEPGAPPGSPAAGGTADARGSDTGTPLSAEPRGLLDTGRTTAGSRGVGSSSGNSAAGATVIQRPEPDPLRNIGDDSDDGDERPERSERDDPQPPRPASGG